MKLTNIQYGVIIAALLTAVLHLVAAFDKVLFPESPDVLFILNGLGYLGLLGAYFLPIPFFQGQHKLVNRVLIGFALLTIAAWVFIWVVQAVIIHGEPFFSYDSIYGVPAKLSEAALIYFLIKDKQ